MHWSLNYLGRHWTPEQDCYYWFATIQHAEFRRPVPHASGIDPSAKAQALISERRHHWQRVPDPKHWQDGDAVLLYQAGRTHEHHHIGVWCSANDGAVLHAPENGRIQLDDLTTLQLTGWRIREVLTYA